MKYKLIFILAIVLCCSQQLRVFADNSLESNIEYVENSIHDKIKQAKSKAEKYKNNLNYSKDEIETQRWIKKLESTEKKIKDLSQVLLGIEELKMRTIN